MGLIQIFIEILLLINVEEVPGFNPGADQLSIPNSTYW